MPNAYQAIILAEASLSHYYEMDDAGPNTLADSKGVRNGTYHNGFTLGQAGIPAGGTAATFSAGGGGGYADIGTFSVGGTGETLEAWLKLTANPTAEGVVAAHDGDTNLSTYLAIKSTGVVRGVFTDGGGQHEILSTGPISLNAWHHLAISAPTSGTAHLYVDGVAQTAGTACGTPVGVGSALGAAVGATFFGSSRLAAATTATVDEVAWYSSGLSAANIMAHYTAGIPTVAHGAVLLMAM